MVHGRLERGAHLSLSFFFIHVEHAPPRRKRLTLDNDKVRCSAMHHEREMMKEVVGLHS